MNSRRALVFACVALTACGGGGGTPSQPFDTTITTRVQFIIAPGSDRSAQPHPGAKLAEPAYTINSLNVDDALIAAGYAKPYYWLFKPGYKQDEDRRSLMLTPKGKAQGWNCKTTQANPENGIQGETDCDIPVGNIVASDVKASDPPFGPGKIYTLTCVAQPNELGRSISGRFFSPNWSSKADAKNWTFGKTETCDIFVAPDGKQTPV